MALSFKGLMLVTQQNQNTNTEASQVINPRRFPKSLDSPVSPLLPPVSLTPWLSCSRKDELVSIPYWMELRKNQFNTRLF